MTFRAASNYINDCSESRRTVITVRTFSLSHFENGNWNSGETATGQVQSVKGRLIWEVKHRN